MQASCQLTTATEDALVLAAVRHAETSLEVCKNRHPLMLHAVVPPRTAHVLSCYSCCYCCYSQGLSSAA